jgi:hypothetical protein
MQTYRDLIELARICRGKPERSKPLMSPPPVHGERI